MKNEEIRSTLKAKRSALATETSLVIGETISQSIANLAIFQNAKTIGFYFPVGNEVDCRALIKLSRQQTKRCFLPRLTGEQLEFAAWEENTVFENNRFGIPEPSQTETISPLNLDLVLVPLVAFTKYCHRLGMGAGYYDKTFTARLSQRAPPHLIGLAYEWQKVEDFDHHLWDVPMDLIVTESSVYFPE